MKSEKFSDLNILAGTGAQADLRRTGPVACTMPG